MTFLEKKCVPALVGLAIAVAAVPVTGAQCGSGLKGTKPMSWRAGRAGGAVLRTVQLDEAATDTIVGMWHVQFIAHTNNGDPIRPTVVDNALTVFHSDKTEIMNSGRPPQDGNFCMGVSREITPKRYRLNHFAWGANNYQPNSVEGVVGPPVGGVHYTEELHLEEGGMQFVGGFTITVYDTVGRAVQSFTGTVKGTRITVSTPFSDLL